MALFSVCLLLIGCLTVNSNIIKRSMYCRNCPTQEECNRYPAPNGICEFGPYRDICEFANCFRGPGERCSLSKRCAEGLECLCGRCTGCLPNNIDQPCYSRSTFCPDSQYMQ